jgi:hypothetical protein
MENKYEQWIELSEMLSRIKKEELELRLEICEGIFNGRVGEFKEKVEVEDFLVEATSKTNRTVDEVVLQNMWKELNEVEQAAIKFKPSIDLRRYRMIPDDSLLHEAITEKPATPTLSISRR